MLETPQRLDVTIFVRQHDPNCQFPDDEKRSSKCRCPKWLYIGDGRKRISAKTRSWSEAERIAQSYRRNLDPVTRELRELTKQKKSQDLDTTLEAAFDKFLADKQTSGAVDETIAKYRTIKRQLLEFAAQRGVIYLRQVDTALLTDWRATWRDKKYWARRGKQERTISFFAFCVRLALIDKNPAGGQQNPNGGLSPIQGDDWIPTLPFTREQYTAILAACHRMKPCSNNQRDCRNTPERLSVFIQVMRWSGLAIRDTATLKRSQLRKNDTLELRRSKSGVPVTVPLPHSVADALRHIPPGTKPNSEYFFWSGEGSPKSEAGKWDKLFRRLWKVVDPPLDLRDRDGNQTKPHSHMLRDTFAVEFLQSGHGDLRDLAILLGNTQRICEKHYLAFVPSVAERLEQRVRSSWAVQGAPV